MKTVAVIIVVALIVVVVVVADIIVNSDATTVFYGCSVLIVFSGSIDVGSSSVGRSSSSKMM